MTLVLADRVRDTTTTTGTGTVTLSGTAPTGFQNFSVVGDGNTTYYTISGGSQWETGIGTYSSTGPTLTRTTVLASSNSGSLVNFSAGTKDVFVTYPAEKSVNYDDNGQVVIGVGGASDTALLDVEGNIYAASAIRAGGGIDLPAGFGNYWRASLPSGAYQGGLTYNGGLRFYSGNVVNERMRIDTVGNIGIGTSSITPVFGCTVKIYNAGSGGTLEAGGSTVNARLYASEGAAVAGIGTTTNTPFQFITNDTLRATITGTGNIGIGTSAPSNQLSVGGNTSATISFDWTGDSAAKASIITDFSTGEVRYGAVTNYFPTFYAGNAERMRIDTSGNVGIGTTTMAGRFNVTGATTNLLYGVSSTNNAALKLVANSDVNTICNVQNSGGNLLLGSNGTGEYMRINTSGNVGIGTSSPGYKLDVSGGVVGNTAGNSLSINRLSGGAGVNTVQLQTTLNRLSNGTDWTTTALRVQAQVDSSPFGYIDFLNGSSAAMAFGRTSSEFMRIDSSGNVLVGSTATPSGSGINVQIAGNATTRLWMTPTAGRVYYLETSSSSNALQFIDGTAGSERMRISSGGNVGIGTTNPTSLLDVNGNAEVNGTLFLGASNHGNLASDTNTLYLRGTNIAFQNAAGSGTYAYINSSGVLTVGGANVAIGFQSTGQQVIGSSTALDASNLGTNILVVTGGITLTLPTSAASGKVISISNISGSNITLSYTGSAGTDGPTTLAAQTSLMLVSDGGSPPFWRAFFPSGGFDGSTLFQTGYKLVPQNQRTGAYTLALTDIGKHIYATAANFNITIPANSSVAFPIGTAITIVVEDQFHTLVPAAGVTLVLAGTGAATTGTRTLAQGSVSTIIKVGTDRWYISGSGVT